MSFRRPLLQHKRRPSSAVFLGSDISTTNLPDLPGPPSPGTNSNDGSSGEHSSGLPSPPATDSTGGGSNGDKSSISARNQRPVSLDMFDFDNSSSRNNNNNNHNNENAPSTSAGSNYDIDEDNDEDSTARLDRRLSVASDNESALQRVKTLAQRNRMVIDKLSSFSRTSSPNISARSPLPPRSSASASTSSSSSNSSNSRNRHERTISITSAIYSNNHSGSDTERDSRHSVSSHAYDDDDDYDTTNEDLSLTPPAPPKRSTTPIRRSRLQSAPTSPAKALLARAGQTVRNSTQRKRVSLADAPEYEEDEVSRAALAAVASSRRSPNTLLAGNSGNNKRRQPLPREFLDGGTTGRFSAEPMTPHRDRAYERERTLSSSISPQKLPLRSSTVRDLSSRRSQTRWASEDLSSIAARDEEEYDVPVGGRAQGTRGGSAESALGHGRSLAGQGLRAAGIGVSSRDRGVEDMFTERRHRISHIDDDLRERSRSRLGGTFSRQGGSRAATSMAEFRFRDEGRYYDDDRDDEYIDEGGARKLRSMKSTHPANDRDRTRDRDRAESSLGRYPPASAAPDRTFASPFGSRRVPATRESLPPLPTTASSMEHTRLMTDALTMFEAHLSRLPFPSPANVAASEVLKNAQSVVDSTDKLNSFLRTGSSKAMEQHVNAEVGDLDDDGEGGSKAAGEVWKKVSADYRDGLRLSDELVRGLTGFLLGVSKVMRDAVGDSGQFVHGRSVSLDETVVNSGGSSSRRSMGRMSLSPEVSLPNGSGRRSVESRRSAESRRSWGADDDAGGPSVAPPPSPSKPGSATSGGSAASATPPTRLSRDLSSGSAAVAIRRTMTPQDRKELSLSSRTPDIIASIDSQATIHGYEPSPTPASRRQVQDGKNAAVAGTSAKRPQTLERSRSLAPLAIPAPLPALPSESKAGNGGSVRRSATVAVTDRRTTSTVVARTNRTSRPSTATTGTPTTVRGNPKFNISSSNTPTTAVTPHTVSNSPHRQAFPLSRTSSTLSGSGSGSRSSPRNGSDGSAGVTFSRPSQTISVSATLNGLSQRDNGGRNRATSTASQVYEDEERGQRSGVPPALDNNRLNGTTRNTRRSLDGNAILQQAAAVGGGGGGSRRGSPAVANTMLPATGRSKERRRTVTEIFSS